MRCRDVQAALPEYLDQALPDAKRQLLAAHFAECNECRCEHAAYERAAHALSMAPVVPPADLWQSLQARLNAEPPLATCDQVRSALPEWIDGASTSLAPRLVADHLGRCRACAAEERRLVEALEHVDRVGRAGSLAAPDLWPAFDAKVAATYSCDEIGDRLPAYLAGERSTDTLAIEQHLDHCRHCASAAADYSAALGALDRTVRTQPQPDLWASMSARVAIEQESRNNRSAAWLQAFTRRQVWMPTSGAVLIAAAVLVAAFVFRGQGQPALTTMARVSDAVTVPATAPPAESGSMPHVVTHPHVALGGEAADSHPTVSREGVPSQRPRRSRRTFVAGRRSINRMPLRVASAETPRMVREALPPGATHAERPAWSHKLEVTFNVKQPGVRMASAQPTEPASGPEEKKIEAEVIHAAKMLVSIDDTATRPFEMNADGN